MKTSSKDSDKPKALPSAARYALSVLVGFTVIQGVLTLPMYALHRNPPFHRFDGLDLASWTEGAIIYLAVLSFLVACYRERLVNRYLLFFAIVVNAGFLIYAVAYLISMILFGPTL
jgi:hypothetical protein